MQYKRIIISCLIVILTLCTTLFAVNAAETTPLEVTVGVADATPAVLNNGDTFDVCISIDSNPGLAVFKVELEYDAENLEYVSHKNGNVFTNSNDIIKITQSEGLIKYEYIGSEDVTTSGEVMLTVTFKALGKLSADGSVRIVPNQVSGSNLKTGTMYGEKFGDSAEPIAIVGNPESGEIHTHTYATLVVDATCMNDACTKYICYTCDYIYTETQEGTGGHTPGEWETVADATPESIGYQVQKCTVCEAILATQTISATSHTYDEGVVTPATCTAQGYTTYTCTSCAEPHSYKDNYTDMLEHIKVVLPGVPATCTQNGLTDGEICSLCNTVTVKQDVIVAAGHTEKVIPAVDATCTSTGLTEGKICSVCDTLLVEQTVVAVKAHTEKVLAAVAATCTSTGLTEGKICSVCDTLLKAQDVTPVIAHTEVALPGVAATCTQKGLTDGKVCSVCGTVTVKQEEIAEAGHTEEVIAAVDATCTVAGSTEGKKCSVCDALLLATEVVQPLGHKTQKIPAVEPTYGAVGATEGEECTVCDTVTIKPIELAKKSLAWLWVLIIALVIFVVAAVVLFILVFKKNSMYEKKISGAKG